MSPDVVPSLILLLLVLPISIATPDFPRSSCKAHFLAGQRKTGVYTLGNENVASRLVCEMPADYEGSQTTVTTVVGSALETPTEVKRKSSANFQAADLFWLRELVRTSSDCRQTITVTWPAAPVDSVPSGITLISLLNISTHIAARDGSQTFELTGFAAGVRHLLPDAEGSPRPPTVSSSSLKCRHQIVEKKECLATGGLEIDASPSPWKYEFSFRTDRSDQALLSLLNGDKETTHVRMENDFFLRVDGGPAVTVGQLSDAEWHTVALIMDGQGVRLLVDSVPVEVTTSVLKTSRLSTVHIKVDGEILLQEPCAANRLGSAERKRPPTPLCSGCNCHILPQHFDSLPSSPCSFEVEDDSTFQLLRDPDRLSFIQLPDAFAVDADDGLDVRVAMTFKSDSDAGLLLFGYWHGMPGKGRWQTHYSGSTASALICRNVDGEETCSACSIDSGKGLGEDDWHRVVFFGSGDAFTFSVDRQACHLEPITSKNNISTAEVYAVPAVTQGIGLFVGGTYFEKKKSGLYKQDFTQRFFENTREKMTSLRGCVKDVFVHGKRVDLTKAYNNQLESVLEDSEDRESFAIQIGCASCNPSCPDGVRCRGPAPGREPEPKCDCSDAQLIEDSNDGTCPARKIAPIPLSTAFVAASPVVLPLETTKAVLARLWLKLKLPKEPKDDIIIAEFNSHRETMFRVLFSPGGTLSVVAHPHEGNGFAATASKDIGEGDDRVHLISIARRTPVGTRHTARKYELMIDGDRFELPDTGKSLLNNVTFVLADGTDEEESVIVHDIGVGYDLDEHMFLRHPSNRIHQVDLHARLALHQIRQADMKKVGTLEPYLWEADLSPNGEIVDYSPDVFEPELLLSSRWLFYLIILAMLILLLLLACLCCYCCLARGRARSNASDREQMMRDSPDYAPVKLRRGSSAFSFHDDTSIGTDDTDLNAYRDIPSHRVKIYRESMVSILVPSMDGACEAAIVKRLSVEEPKSPPPPESPAPLVCVNEEEQ